jgi:hypothetical protein
MKLAMVNGVQANEILESIVVDVLVAVMNLPSIRRNLFRSCHPYENMHGYGAVTT